MRTVLFSLVAATLAVAGEAVVWTPGIDGGVLAVRHPQIDLTTVELGGARYVSVGLDGAAMAGDIGAPALPVYRRLVEVPFGAEVDVRARVENVYERTLGLPLAPMQAPVPKSGPVPSFARDAKAYAADAFLPEPGARLADVVEVRGHRIAVIDILPASYNPVENALRVAQVSVDVRWTGADWSRTNRMNRRYASPAFAGRLDGVVLNTERFASDAPPALPIGYLVIVPDAWQQNVQPLADWRRRRGFNVFVRNLTEVGGGSAAAVKAYIQNAYDNWPIPPSFVLLVGDVDRIGYFTGGGQGNPPTDLNFSCVEGADYLPDIDLSRASVASAAQLDTLVSNIIRYEQDGWTNGTSWLKKAYFIASADGGNHQVAERTHAYVMRKLRPMGVECDSMWLYYGSGTPVVTAINDGRAWVTYSGHGSENSWAEPTPTFDVAAVHALTNTDMIPFVQTYACLTGNFASTSYPECFSESWIRDGRRGAIANLASSVTSYWTEDDTLERRVFDCMFDSSATWIMAACNRAKLIYFQQMGANSTTQRYLEMYNLMGDGAIDVNSQEPRQLSVTHPPVIPLGAYPLHVVVNSDKTPVQNALVCAAARNDTAVHVAGYTDASGEVTLSIVTTSPDSIYVTVTGHNLAPYLGAALALPSSGPYVMYLRHVVDDSAGGNRDHIINPGETINLPTWLKNWGNVQAQNVRAWLRASDPNVTLLDTMKQFGDIPAGDSAFTGASGFRFSVAQACTNGYALRFTVVTRDANDSVWQSPLTLAVGAPVLVYASNRADDPPPGGNGNGMIDPGESGDLVVTLRNAGLGGAYGVTATLRSGDARLEVLDSTGGFGNILPETTGSNEADRFRVRADISIPRETRVPCTLYVCCGGSTVVQVFALDVGLIRTMDPIPDGPRTPPRYYAYDVTDVAYSEAPVFSWVEVRGVGNRLTLSDDQTVAIGLPPGFGPFRYYGTGFSQVSICGNGWVAPGSTTLSSYSNHVLPDNEAPGIIAANWDDLYPPEGNGVWWYYDSTGRRFVVEWDSVHYYSPRGSWDKFEVIICDTSQHTETGDNVVLAQYLSANNYTSNTVGMEDPLSQIGINCLTDGSYHRGAAALTPGMTIKYTTNPPRPRVGVVDAGNRVTQPTRLALLGSIPNPFRSRTMLSYSVPGEMKLKLGIYDPSGRKVAELFSGTAEPGIHAACWNGCDSRGRRVGQGVYFYRLESEGTTLVRKTVMVE